MATRTEFDLGGTFTDSVVHDDRDCRGCADYSPDPGLSRKPLTDILLIMMGGVRILSAL